MTSLKIFTEQAVACTALGSPFTGKLLDLLAQNLNHDTAVGRRVLDWPGDASNRADSVPLRLTGALHALVLQGKCPALIAAYPPNNVAADQLWQAVETAFADHTDQIQHWLNSPPQTNEVRRSAALIPVFLSLQDHFKMPLVISELGASAGLNLNCDKFHLTLKDTDFGDPNSPVHLSPDWDGPLPPNQPLNITHKAGCDLNPLDPTTDALRLRAYIWPDQTERLARTEAAIAIAQAEKAAVDKSDAESWLKSRLATQHAHAVHVIYTTIAWQYFPPETQAACEAAIHKAGAAATKNAPLAWVAMEADGKDEGAGLRATLWPDGQDFNLGRADFHGRWVKWRGFIPT